jgi:deoxyribodipyrimidine photo-lyase
MVKPERVHVLKPAAYMEGPIVYWMSRDQRVRDNWALLHAYELAIQRKAALWVIFCLIPDYHGATESHYSFMLAGLSETERDCSGMNIPFFLLHGNPENEIPSFITRYRSGALVTDFDPLAIKRRWKNKISSAIKIGFYEVDAHNIVPCRIASNKREFGAYTIRKKINGLLPEYLENFPPLKPYPFNSDSVSGKTNWETPKIKFTFPESITKKLKYDIIPGSDAGFKTLENFVNHKTKQYVSLRKDPNEYGQSGLSPYIHFGQISAQRVALEVLRMYGPDDTDSMAFLEELIVRRELSDNYCFYTDSYDTFGSLPDWARKTLDEHRDDPREYIYSDEEFESAITHDPLWNAAQKEMVYKGKMHGYMRMYWAKKILEWTHSPEEAIDIAIKLNDRYSLDGRDPNGYAGIMWSIGGLHDRAWQDRPVTGKIRCMNYKGCKRKFDVKKYIESINQIEKMKKDG